MVRIFLFWSSPLLHWALLFQTLWRGESPLQSFRKHCRPQSYHPPVFLKTKESFSRRLVRLWSRLLEMSTEIRQHFVFYIFSNLECRRCRCKLFWSGSEMEILICCCILISISFDVYRSNKTRTLSVYVLYQDSRRQIYRMIHYIITQRYWLKKFLSNTCR